MMPTDGTPAKGLAEDPVERLAKAKSMFEQELISEAEYETLKANILQKMGQ
ncbi:MAG: SHOCT domain-containing protein [Chloroflexi bacterium]|nr:SHOCT domain-containing protein [Chloroflexota bacterium]